MLEFGLQAIAATHSVRATLQFVGIRLTACDGAGNFIPMDHSPPPEATTRNRWATPTAQPVSVQLAAGVMLFALGYLVNHRKATQ